MNKHNEKDFKTYMWNVKTAKDMHKIQLSRADRMSSFNIAWGNVFKTFLWQNTYNTHLN